MNLQIKSSGGSVTIGTTTFNDTPIDLISIDCLNDNANFRDLFNKAKDGEIIVVDNGVDLPKCSTEGDCFSGCAYVSRLIQKKIDGKVFHNYPKLEEDWATG